jgi:phosphotriesterase-related protein
MSGFVRTVLGDVASEELGPTYAHEHLLTRPMGEQIRGDPDLVLDDEQRAAAELRTFLQAGGRALVEASTAELGRDLAGLRRLARRTGVHVVAATGHVCEQYWRGALDLEVKPERALVDGFVRDLTVGMDGTDVRAGVVKVGSSLDRVTDAEARVIRAAAAAQRQTGAPITTHTTAGTAAMAQVRALERAGADLSHVCVGHLDRRLVWEDHLALARTGVFLGYDCVGKEQYQPDAERVRFILRWSRRATAGRCCWRGIWPAGGTWVPGAVARDIGSSSGSFCPACARPGWTTRTRRRSWWPTRPAS